MLQWTAGVILEHVLLGLPVKKLSGGRFEPADFFAVPRRVDLLAAMGQTLDPVDTLRVMAMFTVATGGQLPDSVREALTERSEGGGQRH